MKKSTMAAVLCLLIGPSMAQAQVGTAFTYQGRLVDGAGPANGTYDLQFTLFDAVTAGTQVGTPVTKTGVTVSAGLFTTSLDFGAAAFSGTKRWLEIGVKLPAAGAYTLLTPRQELTPSPNAVFAAKAGDATTIAGLTCANGQVAKWTGAPGAWTCGADTTNLGTVTNVATGAGLTGGPISGSGTVSVATGGVTSAMIGAGQVVKGLNGLADTVTIAGSGGATVSTVGSTITVSAAAPPADCTPTGTLVLGVSGDTTLIGAGYTELTAFQDAWKTTTTVGAPAGRISHTAVWTGSKMIVWGGNPQTNTGGRYDPVSDSWTATTTTNAPTARRAHVAVWTGSKMIVWGGFPALNTGGQYDPILDSWTATTTTAAPAGRQRATAVWTGTRMVVWGGYNGLPLDTGGQYDPTAPAGGAWTATTTTGVPTARSDHTAVWTGSRMIVFGGVDFFGIYLNTGGQYDPTAPAGGSWSATTVTGAPTGRVEFTTVWTGSRMIVWGGQESTAALTNTGGQYDPVGDSWVATTTTGAPSGRFDHSAIWTGSRMVIWGGDDGGGFNSGGQYNPAANAWTATTATGAPFGRNFHSAVWTGSRMIIWGGGAYYNSGAQWFTVSYFMKN